MSLLDTVDVRVDPVALSVEDKRVVRPRAEQINRARASIVLQCGARSVVVAVSDTDVRAGWIEAVADLPARNPTVAPVSEVAAVAILCSERRPRICVVIELRPAHHRERASAKLKRRVVCW